MVAATDLLAQINRQMQELMGVPASMMRERSSTAAQVRQTMDCMATRIIYSPFALEMTAERLFPESKHRSKRIHKKLVKRFGGEYRMRPCIWQTSIGIVAHPNFKGKLEAAIRSSQPV